MMQIVETTSPTNTLVRSGPEWLIVIAASTGGPQALAKVLPAFPPDFAGSIIVVQQMRQGFTRVLADQLNHICRLPIHEPTDGQSLQSSRVLMTPGGTLLSIETLDTSPDSPPLIFLENVTCSAKIGASRADRIMASAAKSFRRNTIGVLLTGVGNDGCDGLRAIAEAGGTTIVQDEDSSVVNDLPASAVNAGVAQETLPLWSIADRIIQITSGDANAIAA
jgi:two-component system chemotaxis response regulator CheB